jgi:hypothetical protein
MLLLRGDVIDALERVELLPAKWQERLAWAPHSFVPISWMRECIDELEAALLRGES